MFDHYEIHYHMITGLNNADRDLIVSKIQIFKKVMLV